MGPDMPIWFFILLISYLFSTSLAIRKIGVEG